MIISLKINFFFMVPDLVHKFQMICPRGTKVIEGKLNDGGVGGRTWVKLNTIVGTIS
jgi:hypothetical protein